MKNKLEEDFVRSVCMQAKLIVNIYAALESSVISLLKSKANASDCLNGIVNVFAEELGLVGLTAEELVQGSSVEVCHEYVDERLRVVVGLTCLILEPLLDEALLKEFLTQIEELATAQKEKIRELLGQSTVH